MGAGSSPPMVWAQEDLFIADYAKSTVTVYARTAQGDPDPLRTLAGPATGLSGPTALAVDLTHDELVVTNANYATIGVYARTAQGNIAPLRTLAGSATQLTRPSGLALDLAH